MKPIIWTVFILLMFTNLYGQQNYKSGKSLSIQMDAFDFVARGFSIWTGYTFGYNKVFVDGGMNRLPDFLNPQGDDFIETRKYFIQTGYYRFLHKPDGLFFGVEGIFQQMEIQPIGSDEVNKNPVLRVAPVIGYEWTPFRKFAPNFTITPWISERFPLYSKAVAFSTTTKTYKTADYNFVMGLNLGYRFNW